MMSAESMSIEELLVKLNILRVDLRLNMGKTEILVGGLDLLKRSG